MPAPKVEPYLAGLDTEDDGEGNPFLWCVVHERGSWTGYARHEALNFLERLAAEQREAGRRLEVWATNLEYDLVNVFDPERIAEVTLRFGRHALCGASWRGADFRDTMRHVPVSVAAFGEMLGFRKVEAGLFKKPKGKRSMAAFTRRCLRDAAITFRTAKFFHETYNGLGVRPRMTLASTALHLWQEHFWGRGVYRPEPEVYEAARAAYYGGRTEAFAVGTFEHVRAIDVASMYPWAMTVAELPLPWGLYTRAPRGADVEPHGIYRARVTSRLRFPVLPVRTEKGLVYPNGTWTGWYVGEELLGFVRHGGTLRVLEGFVFSERARPFDGYVEKLFELKNASRGVARTVYKLLLNGLYGKFSQQGKRVHAIPLERLLTMESPPDDWRAWNGLAIFSTDHAPPPWSNHVWPAFVTARARMRLADEAARVLERGGRVLYCDTDSLIFQGAGRYPKKARRAGDFELRGAYRQALIVGKKEYAIEVTRGKWECHVKGVPEAQRERYLRDGVASFSRPVRIRESARIGEPANVWREVTKERRTHLRGRMSDGTVPTVYVTDAGDNSGAKEGRQWQRGRREASSARGRTKASSRRRAGARTVRRVSKSRSGKSAR